MIYDEYLDLHCKYQAEYGELTVLLYQIGSFYELYSVRSTVENSGPDLDSICKILDILPTRRNKSVLEISRSNPCMAGFPIYCKEKYVEKLVNSDYAVIIYDQYEEKGKMYRKLSRVCLKSNIESTYDNFKNNYILSVYIEKFESRLILALTFIDFSTGNVILKEISEGDNCSTFQEYFRVYLQYKPVEVLLSSSCFIDESIISKLKLESMKSKIYNKLCQIPQDYTKLPYVEGVLNRVYKNTSQLSIFEFLNINHLRFSIISFSILLNFFQDSYDFRLLKPVEIGYDNNLKLANNAIHQLNIDNGQRSVIDILNNTKTLIGKRYFSSRLLNPFSDYKSIKDSYDQIEQFEKNININEIRKLLEGIYDIQKITRKKNTTVVDVLNIYKTLSVLLQVSKRTENLILFSISGAVKLIEFIEESFHVDKLRNECTLIDVLKDVQEVDLLVKESNDLKNVFQSFIDDMPCEVNKSFFSIEKNDRDGFYIQITKKRFVPYLKVKYFENCIVVNTKTINKLFIPNEKQLNSRIYELVHKIDTYVQNAFCDITSKLKLNFVEEVSNVIRFIELIDFYTTCVYNNKCYNLVKPNVVESDVSFLEVKDIRHLIIENVSTTTKYIGNDISLNGSGLVIYGINASGKSSLMKSIGISIILCQSGMYSCCSKITYGIFKQIFTRISHDDNLYLQQSSFVKEMSELRVILQNSNQNTLVLGDEICNGTETKSAVSIVSSAIDSLCRKKTTFLFATHLDEILPFIKQLNIIVKHMSITFDENGLMVYERVLADGRGIDSYGIEVAKSLDMNPDFIKKAEEIRTQLVKKSKKYEFSRYNQSKLVTECEICSSTLNVDIHHIYEQNEANSEGLLKDGFHKNALWNLTAVCSSCHSKIHDNKILIKGYRNTSIGKKLLFHMNEDGFDYNNKDVIDSVVLLKQNFKNNKDIKKELESKYNASFTEYRIRKIIKDNFHRFSVESDTLLNISSNIQ